MPRLSKRGIRMPESPIRKLIPYAEQARQKGIRVIPLNIGQPDIKTPKEAINAIRNFDQDVVEYSPSAGINELLETMTLFYQSIGINITKDQILVTTGGSEALLFAFGSIADPGDEVIIPEPFYANYKGFSSCLDVRVVPIPSRIEENFVLPSIGSFQSFITPKTKAIVICNPSNPTGYLYSKEELLKLKSLVLKHDLFLIVDEVYRKFVYDGKEHCSALNIEGIENHTIVIDSVSKQFSMCGARVGCFISRNEKLISTALKFGQARLSPPTYGQIAAKGAYGVSKNYFEDVREEYDRRRKILVEGLNSILGVLCPNPKGSFYCFVRLPIDDSDRFAQWLLEEFSENNETVLMAPGTGFYSTKGLGKDEVRIAYVLKEEDLKAAINIIKKALLVYPGRTI